jgi:hypothetical protein
MGVSLLYHVQLVLYLREYVGHGGGVLGVAGC